MPALGDVALAAFVTALMVSGSVGESHPVAHATAAQMDRIRAHQPGAAYGLVVVAGAALVLRRRWPLAVLTVSVLLTTIYAAAGYVPGAALCGVFVALFSVGTSQPRHVVIIAAGASMGVLFLASGLGGPFGWLGGTNTVMVASSTASVALGLAVASRRQVFAAMRERAERAERDREEEARRRVDAERLRIARELHDVVAHSMSMINVQAAVAAHVLPSQPEHASAALIAIKDASREGLRELRAILNVLRQVDEDGSGRVPAPRLSQLAALVDASTQAGLPTAVTVSGDTASLPPTVELAAYRIVQESLTNVLRHAGPDAHATVLVSVDADAVTVRVDDDGRGSATRNCDDGSGAGLAGMRERAGACGGTLDAGPRPAGGWQVTAVLPVPSSDAPRPAQGEAG